MLNRTTQIVLIVIMLLQSQVLVAEKSKKGPVLTDYGPVFAIRDRDIALPENYTYKAVFDVTTTASDPVNYSRRLESVARFINMHALNGVAVDKMKLAVVIHGKATKDILTDTAYRKEYKTDNPNQQMIEQLHSQGVKFYVCGQTPAFHGYKREDILPEIQVALSAMTQLIILQDQGYALLP